MPEPKFMSDARDRRLRERDRARRIIGWTDDPVPEEGQEAPKRRVDLKQGARGSAQPTSDDGPGVLNGWFRRALESDRVHPSITND